MNRSAPGSAFSANPLSISKAIDGFLKFKTAEGLSQRTISSYEFILSHWLETIGDRNVSDVQSSDLTGYLAWLRTDYKPVRFNGSTAPLLAKSIFNVWVTFRYFFSWLHVEFKFQNPVLEVTAPKSQKLPVETFTKEDVEKILKACVYSQESQRPEDIAELVVVRVRQELTRLRVNEGAPEVRVEGVTRLEREAGEDDLARVEWSVNTRSSEASQPAALVHYTQDGGHTWQAVAVDVREPRHLLNLDLLSGGEDCRLQVIVSNGLASSMAESEPFRVQIKPRQVVIVSPKSGEAYQEGDPIVFDGAGHSPNFGTTLPDEGLWNDSQKDVLGTGTYFVRSDLRPGTHRITLTTPDGRTDKHGNESTAGVWIKVVEKTC